MKVSSTSICADRLCQNSLLPLILQKWRNFFSMGCKANLAGARIIVIVSVEFVQEV